MDQPKLFLSCSSIDHPSVVAVQKQLEARGVTTRNAGMRDRGRFRLRS